MTALARYDLLEAVGWYAERPEREPVEVLVSFGDASLTILRFDDTPLAHWPLGSLVETPGAAPLTLAPDADAPERLALSDAEMIAAIRALRPGGARKQPSAARARARRLARRAAALAAAALALFALWLATPLREQGLPDEPRPTLEVQLGMGAPFCRQVTMWNGEWRRGPASNLADLMDRLASDHTSESLPPR